MTGGNRACCVPCVFPNRLFFYFFLSLYLPFFPELGNRIYCVPCDFSFHSYFSIYFLFGLGNKIYRVLCDFSFCFPLPVFFLLSSWEIECIVLFASFLCLHFFFFFTEIFFFFLGVNVVGEYEREHFYNVNTSKGDLGQMD